MSDPAAGGRPAVQADVRLPHINFPHPGGGDPAVRAGLAERNQVPSLTGASLPCVVVSGR